MGQGQGKEGQGTGKAQDKGKRKGFQRVRKGRRVHKWCGRFAGDRGAKRTCDYREGAGATVPFFVLGANRRKKRKNMCV